MADHPKNLNELLRTPAFGNYDNVLANHLTNEATIQGFDIENLGIIDVKNLSSVLSEYNKKSCANAPIFAYIQIQRFLALHRHVQVKFLHFQAFMADSILSILSKIKQDYTSASAGIGAEDKDVKSAVTSVIFNCPDKVIPLLAY